jgi:hypothetical protein
MGEFFLLIHVKTQMNCYYYHIIKQIEYTTDGSVPFVIRQKRHGT